MINTIYKTLGLVPFPQSTHLFVRQAQLCPGALGGFVKADGFRIRYDSFALLIFPFTSVLLLLQLTHLQCAPQRIPLEKHSQ
jgi:hypothetical protein